MAIELKEVLEYFGSKAESIDDFKKEVESRLFTKDAIFKDPALKEELFGRAFGSATTEIKKRFANMGVELTGDEVKNPIEKVVDLAVEKLIAIKEAEKQEIEKKVGASTDERIKVLESANTELKQKRTEFENLLKTKSAEFETVLKNKDAEVKGIHLKTRISKVQSGLPYLPDVDPYKKKGFLAEMNERFEMRLDEEDNDYIVEKTSGNRLKSPKVHGTFMTPEEVYLEEGVKAGIINMNPSGGKLVGKVAPAKKEEGKAVITPNQPIFANGRGRTLSDGALKAAQGK